MDPNSHPVDSDDHPHPKLVDFVGIVIALLTLTFPLSMVFRYAPSGTSGLGFVPPALESALPPAQMISDLEL